MDARRMKKAIVKDKHLMPILEQPIDLTTEQLDQLDAEDSCASLNMQFFL